MRRLTPAVQRRGIRHRAFWLAQCQIRNVFLCARVAALHAQAGECGCSCLWGSRPLIMHRASAFFFLLLLLPAAAAAAAAAAPRGS